MAHAGSPALEDTGRHLVAGLVVAVAVLLVPLPALAQSFDLPEARVRLDVQPDGALVVTEEIAYSFDGSFSGAYREVPLGAGESIDDVTVSEGETVYAPGGCTDLGCSSPAGTFGVRMLGDRLRIVWHYEASDEARTFTLRYRAEGVAKAYDDVVDVNWQVWGEEWEEPLARLNAAMALPGEPASGDVRVWGHPASVSGSTDLGPGEAFPQLTAEGIPSGQFVELRVVFPRSLLEGTRAASVVEGEGLDQILEEERREADRSERASAVIRRLLWLLPVLALVPAGLAGLVIWWKFGREPRVDYDRRYEQEPPDDLSPAEVGALLSQGRVGPEQFTATLFDLIRRGVVLARPVQVERETWGGLRSETISDLELELGTETSGLRDFEQRVLTVVRRALDDGPLPLHEFRERIRDDASANAETYRSFTSQVDEALERSGRLIRDATRWMVLAFGVWLLVGVAAVLVIVNLDDPRVRQATVVVAAVAMIANLAILIVIAASRRVMTRRSRDGALQAARWEAFRRYLEDFSRLEEAPPIALELWDRFLVYGITLGVAEEVLAAARIKAPAELEQHSHIYWYGGSGYTGGSTESAFAGLNSSLSGAFAPPGGSGGGGGFSGGGGGGSGGGGGGAW